MQDLTPTPAAEPKAKTLYAFFRDLFSRMAIGQCVHAALCVAVGAAIGLSTGRTSTALGIVLGVLMLFNPMLSFVSMGALIGSDLILLGVESIVFFIGNCKYRNW